MRRNLSYLFFLPARHAFPAAVMPVSGIGERPVLPLPGMYAIFARYRADPG